MKKGGFMAKLTNAPYLKEPWNNEPLSDLLVLVGSEAWHYWGKGKNEQWKLIADGFSIPTFKSSNANVIRYEQTPVILGAEQLAEINRIRIAHEKQRFIKFIQCGTLTEKQKTALCLNVAEHTKAEKVTLFDAHTLSVLEELSGYIQRLRTGESSAIVAGGNTSKIKEGDRTNEKARAFKNWLGLDIALQRVSREVYAYDGKIWGKIDADNLEEKAVAFLDENELGYSDKTINSLINTLKAQLPRMADTPNDLIAFNNGTLNRTTLEFLPHYRENWLMSYIPHEYLNSAQNTPYFDKWLEFVSGGKENKKNAILAALYAILTNRNGWQLFFEITGDGGSGKSVFANIATLLAGEQNTESGRLIDLDEPRGRESFVGKTLLICPEQSRYGGDGGGLKSISGGDPVNIDPKHRTKFKAIIPAVVLIVNNEATRFTERSGGIERRRVIFHFDKVVPKNERDPNFMDKIEREVGGIIYKLIHTFEQPETAKAALEEQQKSDEALEIKSESDHITEFCGYFYTTPQNDGLYIGNATLSGKERTHLYPAYLVFARASGIANTLTLRNFSNSLKQGFAQHKNKFEFSKIKGKYGYRSNVHFKNYEEFKNEFIP